MIRKLLLLMGTLFFLAVRPALAMPEIRYDHQTFHPDTLSYDLKGNVSVKVGSRVITADEAVVSLLTNEVRAKGNIRLVQDDLTFTGSAAVVRQSTHSADVDGPLTFVREGLEIRADRGSFDWESKLARFEGHVRCKRAGQAEIKKDVLIYNVEKDTFQEA
jgi:lipopolysaccharide export system protein LptA